ncbi:SPOR domain-containing protein [Lewinella cohaerens]|uniref:SPOR domain-containing protein n=1 Tax=Lewinella cohaerens TaxID=70995 RepID=UPI0005C4E398|nr:SPOR domain-containing protein [Lewinella cohaerens]
MKKYLFLLPLMVFSCFLMGQSVQVKMDPIIGDMLDQYTAVNQSQNTVSGWRVQILATTSRERLESVQQSFRYHYPNIPVEWEHSRPYYKLQAGAFRTKRDALRLKYILSREYEGLYLVRDDAIAKGELLNYY